MSIKQIIIVSILGLAAIGSLLYGFGVFQSAPPPQMLLRMDPVKDRKTGQWIAQPTFGFSAPIRIRSLRVYHAAEFSSQGELALPVWAVAGNPLSQPLREFRYGQFIPGTKLEKKGERAIPLVGDQQYQLVLKTDHGEMTRQFTYGPEQK